MKQKDASTNQLGLLFEIQYPEIERGLQPRYRFMSAFEQKVQAPDKNFQYLVFAAAPYENIAFKIPNKEIDKTEDKFMTQWNTTTRVFKLQLFFKTDEQIEIEKKQREASHTAPSLKIEYRGRLLRVCLDWCYKWAIRDVIRKHLQQTLHLFNFFDSSSRSSASSCSRSS